MDIESIGNILSLHRGYDLTTKEMNGGAIPVAGSNGIIGFHNQSLTDAPAVTVGRSGSVGKVHYYEEPIWPHNTSLYVDDFKGNSPAYIYYLLSLLDLGSLCDNSVIPSLNRNFVYPLKVPFIKGKVKQEKYISILRKIDKLISIKREINVQLEALAKQIYDYWFVQFDFPNEEGKPYKSSGGKMVWNEKLKREIPDGWNADSIASIADILSGGTPSKAEKTYWNGIIPFFGPTDYSGNMFQINTAEYITEDGLKHCASQLYEEGTIFITARGSIGKLVIVGKPMAMNQSCYALKEKDGHFEYLYFLTKQLIDILKIKGNGSVFKSIIASDIETSILCIGAKDVIEHFSSISKELFGKILNNTREIDELQSLRSFLLPLLMNGQITIKD